MKTPKTLLLLGATGLVGKQILSQALASDQVAHIVAPTRKKLDPHEKLTNPIVDFNMLPDSASWWKADAILCALGTTIKQAGSKQAFRQVDYGYVVRAAELAKKARSECFVLNSSLGADAGSGNFYLKVKGELENDLAKLGFKSLTCVRPSLLDGGPRPENRPGEQMGLWFSRRLSIIIPKRYQPVSTEHVARAMLDAALLAMPGTHCIESEQLHY